MPFMEKDEFFTTEEDKKKKTVLQKKADQFIGQFNGSVTENLTVARVAAAKDTEALELAFGEATFHFFLSFFLPPFDDDDDDFVLEEIQDHWNSENNINLYHIRS